MTVIRQVRGNVFTSGSKHIAFGVNAEGHNHEGFAGMVVSRYWRELGHPGPRQLGEVMSHKAGGYTFHALVCHFNAAEGFAQTPRVITRCLNAIEVPDTEVIACVMVGGGFAGQALGANTAAIISGMQASRKKIVVYSL